MYFHAGTQSAIMEYQNTEDQEKREELYVNDILPAFGKLVENLIFIHGFAKVHGSYEDLKSDCVSFLYETIHKWDPERGTKAFSYFNVVAKNWLIIQSKKTTKNNRRNVSMDDSTSLSSSDLSIIENFKIAPAQDTIILQRESKENMFKMMREIRKKVSGENEIACIDAIITLFQKIDDLDLLNKRAVFVYMRDLSNLNPKQLSIAMSVIRKHYKSLVKQDEFDIFF
tara:strand:- start:517 stop:1197 length:681 start_codon:yes stop_codon:yes gene_type:complete